MKSYFLKQKCIYKARITSKIYFVQKYSRRNCSRRNSSSNLFFSRQDDKVRRSYCGATRVAAVYFCLLFESACGSSHIHMDWSSFTASMLKYHISLPNWVYTNFVYLFERFYKLKAY